KCRHCCAGPLSQSEGRCRLRKAAAFRHSDEVPGFIYRVRRGGQTSVMTSWDLIVVGYGAAGVATSLTAARAGAKVLLIEKQAEDAHYSSTRMSGGLVM